MNVNSTSSTYKASSSNGMSGLASGLDTDSMVDAMLSGTQAKIDKQQGIRQQTLWKQEIYRDIIKTINNFHNKYFSTSNGTNFLSSSFFNLMNAASKSNAFKVTATSNAAAGKVKLKVDQLATSTKLTSSAAVSGKLQGSIDAAKLQNIVDEELNGSRELKLSAGGQDITVDLKDVFVTSGGQFTTTTDEQKLDAIAAKINTEFQNAGVTTASAQIKNGSLVLTNSDKSQGIQVSAASDDLALKNVGLKAGRESVVVDGKMSLSSKPDLSSSFSVDISLDDSVKTINVDLRSILQSGTTNVDVGKFKTELQAQINRAHGTGNITLSGTGNDIELVVASGRKVMVGGSVDSLDALGYKSGQSNKIGMGGNLSDLYFETKLQGDRFKFTINGETFNFSGDANMTEVISKINSSDAGVRVVYKPLEDKFVMESTSSGKGFDITMSQEEGNLLNAMFGSGINGQLASGSKVTSGKLTANTIAKPEVLSGAAMTMKEGTFNVSVNGQSYAFKLDKKSDGTDYTRQEIIDGLNDQFDKKFGTGNINLQNDGSLSINNGARVEFAQTKLDTPGDMTEAADKAQKGDLALAFGFGVDGADNLATGTTTLNDLGINITGLPGTTALDDLATVTGGDLAFEDGRLVYSGSATAITDPATMEKLFGVSTFDLGTPPTGLPNADYQAGQNAIVEIDGVVTERNSNSFNINGLNIEITEVNAAAEEITVSRGTDQIVDGIKSFIKDYNDMIDDLNKTIREDANYKKYAPLTDAQKKEMSDREIELWEEKSKQGLLKGDSTISSFLQSMRSALYEKPAGSSIAIYDIGIETSSDWKDFGKLVLSTDGEAKLRQAVESNPDEVINLFTNPTDGVATKLDSIIKDTANESSGAPGKLVQIAGLKNKVSETNNELYKRLAEMDKKIAALKRTYEKEKSRYWRQFNSMEQVVSNLNNQSSYLMSQLGM